MSLREEYEAVCFSYNEKKAQLLDFNPDYFTLQPEIIETIEEFHALEMRKHELERQLEGGENE